MLDIAHRHATGIQADDHLIDAAQPSGTLRYQLRAERSQPVPRHVQIDITDLRQHRFRRRAVTRVIKQGRVRIALVIAHMRSQFGLQTCLASGIVSHFGGLIRPHCGGLADPRESS